jgi:hypothetical protein
MIVFTPRHRHPVESCTFDVTCIEGWSYRDKETQRLATERQSHQLGTVPASG